MTATLLRFGFVAAATLLVGIALPDVARAQIRASELASVSQTVDGTVISVEYSRPRLRGRTGVFGGRAVPWNRMWTPGANWATTIDASRDVRLEGRPLARGKYSVWLVPRATGDWTLILDPKSHLFHENPPDSSAAQFRTVVHPGTGPMTEALTFSFPELSASGATLVMQWETQRLALDVRVTPSLPSTTAVEVAQPYIGAYDVVRQDTSEHFTGVVVLYDQGTLKAEFVPSHPYFKRFALIQVAPDTFVPGIYDKKGEIYEVMRPDVSITFSRNGQGRLIADARGEDDSLWWSAVRKP